MLRPRPNRFRQRGLTLIELLVVMTIGAILLAIGVPMFTNTIASARTSDAANSVTAALELARSEALRRGLNVTVCRATDLNAVPPVCGAGAVGNFPANDWAAGWIVFVDNGATPGAIDAGEEVVLRQSSFGNGVGPRPVIAGDTATVTYGPNGLRFGAAGAPARFDIAYRDTASMSPPLQARCVTVAVLGQTATARAACP